MCLRQKMLGTLKWKSKEARDTFYANTDVLTAVVSSRRKLCEWSAISARDKRKRMRQTQKTLFPRVACLPSLAHSRVFSRSFISRRDSLASHSKLGSKLLFPQISLVYHFSFFNTPYSKMAANKLFLCLHVN